MCHIDSKVKFGGSSAADAPVIDGWRSGAGRHVSGHHQCCGTCCLDQEIATRVIGDDAFQCLPPDIRSQLCSSLKPVALTLHDVLKRAGEVPRYLYFVNRGLVSYVKSMEDGRTVEIGAVGRDAIVGTFALHNQQPSIWEAVVQIPGDAFRVQIAVVKHLTERYGCLRRVFQKHFYVMGGQLAQNAACNRLHSMEERFARRLLVAHDSVESDTVPLTHETLALMLGVQRAGLSITAANLQRAGLIRYRRGHVMIRDRAGLEAVACECYRTVRSHRDQVFGGSWHQKD